MSKLVERPSADYQNAKWDAFSVTSNYNLENARAMMWMSQLAYETANEAKIGDILGAWGFRKRVCIDNPTELHLPLNTACVIVAGGRGATIVAFAGTDPAKINDWITDFSALPVANGAHMGFQEAVTATWEPIRSAIDSRPQTEQAVFFTGHSLGGALAIVAAKQALSIQSARPTAIYTYGSPRPGDMQFADTYTPVLGDATFRLIHSTDIVPTVPPSLQPVQFLQSLPGLQSLPALLGQLGLPSLPDFRHVGRAIQCSSDGHFDSQTPISSRDADVPDIFDSLPAGALIDLKTWIAGKPRDAVRPGLLGKIIQLLPSSIQDHVPYRYFQALAPQP
jgi:triacylglycerol lipase